jgi:hypothetical protein
MSQEIISDINRVKHLGLYKFTINNYNEVKLYLACTFICIVAFAVFQYYITASIFAALFGVPIILISIDRALQFIQINILKRKYNINSLHFLNENIRQSSRPWMVV